MLEREQKLPYYHGYVPISWCSEINPVLDCLKYSAIHFNIAQNSQKEATKRICASA